MTHASSSKGDQPTIPAPLNSATLLGPFGQEAHQGSATYFVPYAPLILTKLVISVPALACHALLFDLDGVLVDSNEIYEAHWRVWAKERNISAEHILAIHHGRPVEETIAQVAPHLDAYVEAQAYKNGLEVGSYLHRVRAYAGVHDLLQSLPHDCWAIVTSAPRAFALKLLDQLALPRPHTFVSGEDVGVGKPEPYPFLRAAWGLQHDIESCVAIEDAPAGITAARRAGARVIALSTTNDRERLRDADFIVAELADLAVTVNEDGVHVAW